MEISALKLALVSFSFFMKYFLIAFFGLLALFSCSGDSKDLLDQPIYDGPMTVMDSIQTVYSDSAIVKLKIKASKKFSFQNGDDEYPEGIALEFYDKIGGVISTLVADKAYYVAEEKHYKGVGNVIVVNLETGDRLNTEELYWKPNDEKVYTDKFVTIRSEDEVHTGEGLIANQDFDNYQIMNPTGTIVIQDPNENN